MLFISYIFLALSMIFVFLFFLHRQSKFYLLKERSKKYLIITVILYLTFVSMAYLNHQSNIKNKVAIQKEMVNWEKQKTNMVVPIEITPHSEFKGKVGQKLVFNFSVTNKSSVDLDKFNLLFENDELFKSVSVNSTNPQSQINKNNFLFGKLPAGSIQNYSIEITPVKSLDYHTQISFRNDQKLLLDNKGQIIKDNLKVTVYP